MSLIEQQVLEIRLFKQQIEESEVQTDRSISSLKNEIRQNKQLQERSITDLKTKLEAQIKQLESKFHLKFKTILKKTKQKFFILGLLNRFEHNSVIFFQSVKITCPIKLKSSN